MPALEEMTPRELVRGLMRGDRETLKLGYSPENAMMAAKRIRPDEGEDELRLYAQGFSDGMQRSQTMASQGDTETLATDAYCVGFVHGLLESVERTYPSSEAV